MAALVVVAAAAAWTFRPLPAAIVVGSKSFTESVVLGELATLLLRGSGVDAEHRAELGGTRVLFAALEQTLDHVELGSGEGLSTICLSGLWHIVDVLGFAPQLDECVVCGTELGPEEIGRFDLSAGGVRCEVCGEGAAGPRVGPGARSQIRQLLQGQIEPAVTHPRRHLGLLSDFIAYHLAAKPLKSLEFLGGLLPAEPI